MPLKNTSRYPISEVRALVTLGFRVAGCAMSKVAIHVKNSKFAYAGMAYKGIPRISSAHGKASHLVTLRVGAPDRFKLPVSNMVTTVRWGGPWMTREELHAIGGDVEDSRRTRIKYVGGVQLFQCGQAVRHPYGGKRSPHILLHNWQEALVAIAAHEARHIYQYRRKKRLSEVDCERVAAKALEIYRREKKEGSRP